MDTVSVAMPKYFRVCLLENIEQEKKKSENSLCKHGCNNCFSLG